MDEADADEVLGWRRLDREVQDLTDPRRRHAQIVVDIAEQARSAAVRRGTDPVDDLLDAYAQVALPRSRTLVTAAIAYLRVDTAVTPDRVPGPDRRTGAEPGR